MLGLTISTLVASSLQLKHRLQASSLSESKLEALAFGAFVSSLVVLATMGSSLKKIEEEKENENPNSAKITALRNKMSSVTTANLVFNIIGMFAEMMIVYQSAKYSDE